MGFAWELLFVGADAALVVLFYRLYKQDTKAADAVKAAPKFEVGSKLQSALEESDSKSLPYACVRGLVKPTGETIPSQYEAGKEGVVQHLLHVEHKSKRVQGYWSDAKHIIQDTINSVPFKLTSTESDSTVHVVEPLSASYIHDNLRETFDSFEPTKPGFLEAGLDRLFGDVSKGFQKTERMLTIGTPLLGLGKLTLSDGRITLKPPAEHPYILTTMTRSEVAKSMASQARIYKVLAWIFGTSGVIVFFYWLYKKYQAWQRDAENNRVYAEIERDRLRAQEARDAGQDAEEDRSCVVCLTNPREVVILECGHVCVCGDCARALPEPRKCPVCRAPIARLVSTYVA